MSEAKSRREKYQEYIESCHWLSLRGQKLKASGSWCASCDHNGASPHVHHVFYRNLIDCTVEDLVVLCDNCHGLFHGHVIIEYKPPSLKGNGVRFKVPKNLTLPHTEKDLEMPPGDVIVLNRELIDKCRANGSFTNATLRAFGLRKPLVSGWIERLFGEAIPRDKYLEALKGRFIYKSGPLATAYE